MLYSAILSLLAATAVFGQKHGSKACARELEGIVFVPSNCAYSYLQKISEVLRAQSPLLWTSQASGVIRSFEATYGVRVGITNALGEIGHIDAAGQFVPLIKDMEMNHSYARSNALGEGFTANMNVPVLPQSHDVYSSVFWNANGQMYTVGIAIDSANAPNFC